MTLSLKRVVTYPMRPSAMAVKPKSGATPASAMAASSITCSCSRRVNIHCGGGVEDAAIGELVPAVPPAHASVEQAQASPLTCPAELHLKRRRHPSAASVVGAAVLEANPPSQRQDGFPVDGCTRLSHGLRPPSSWRAHS